MGGPLLIYWTATKNASLTACGAPIRDRTGLVIGFGAGGGAVALVVFFVRIYAKLTVPAAQLGYDDLCITIAMVSSWELYLH